MHKRVILFLLLLFLIDTLCANSVIRIPFEMTKNLIIIKLKVNNSDSLNFIFDTGQFTATIDSSLSDSLSLVHIDSGTVNCTSGIKKYYLTRCDYSVEDFRFDTVISYISSFKKYSTLLNRPIHGIIGYDLFRQHILYLNYDSLYLELYDPSVKKKWPGKSFTLHDTLAPAINAEITLLNGKKIKGKYVIDSGSNAGITLSSMYTDTSKILEYITDTVIKRYTNTCGTSMKAYDGYTKSFKIGKHRIDNIPVSLTTAKKGVLAEGRYAGLIGAQVLKYYNVMIDLNRKVAYASPNQAYKKRLKEMQKTKKP